jgi:hypothetical protein
MTTSETGIEPISTEKYLVGKRKFIVWWAVFLSSCGFLAWGKLSGELYADLVMAAFGLYMAGNVGEHWTKRGQ